MLTYPERLNNTFSLEYPEIVWSKLPNTDEIVMTGPSSWSLLPCLSRSTSVAQVRFADRGAKPLTDRARSLRLLPALALLMG